MILLFLLTLLTTPDGSTLEDRIAALLPRPEEETWRLVPWRADLLEARREAADEGKLLFMWIMNGNPLGCT